MDYERRQIYRGPEEFVDLPDDPRPRTTIDDALAEHPGQRRRDRGRRAGSDPKKIIAVRQNGDRIEITVKGCGRPSPALSDKARPRSRSAAAR